MSVYVIMNVGTEHLYHKPNHYSHAYYATERGAKSACTKLNKRRINEQYVVMTSAEFEKNHNPFVVVYNLITKRPVEIRRADVGSCIDPSMELYHCM